MLVMRKWGLGVIGHIPVGLARVVGGREGPSWRSVLWASSVFVYYSCDGMSIGGRGRCANWLWRGQISMYRLRGRLTVLGEALLWRVGDCRQCVVGLGKVLV